MDEDQRFNDKLEQYKKEYDIDDINDANDISTLYILIRTELMVDAMQKKMQELIDVDMVDNASDIKKLADLLRDAIETSRKLQQVLGIDRRTRREKEDSMDVASYIRFIKHEASKFLENRLKKVYCDDCKVLVGRYSSAFSFNAYSVSFQCNQCKKMVTVEREEKDYMFDIDDKEWRTYKAEVIQPSTELFDQNEDTSLLIQPEEELEGVTSGLEINVEEI